MFKDVSLAQLGERRGWGEGKRRNQRDLGGLAQKTRPMAVAFARLRKQEEGGAHPVAVVCEGTARMGQEEMPGSTWVPRSAAQQRTLGHQKEAKGRE